MRFEIIVRLKPEVLDPEARAIQESLNSKYPDSISHVSMSRRFEVEVNTTKESDGSKLAQEIAQNYLANPVSESFEVRALS